MRQKISKFDLARKKRKRRKEKARTGADIGQDEWGDNRDLEHAASPGGKMPLLGHIVELRKRLVICVGCILIFLILCLFQAEWFTNLMLSRGQQFSFVYIAPAELLMCYVQIAMIGGMVFSVPVIVSQIWMFIRPGLKRKEQFRFFAALVAGLSLFCLGAVFAFVIVLPVLLDFYVRLNSTGTVTAMVSVKEYINYVLSSLVSFGFIFETPIVLFFLTALGIVQPQMLQKNFKYVVLSISVVAAFITPPDITSQILVGIPLIVLFYASILLCQIIFRRRLARNHEL